jgi:hypothetical protein
MIIIIFFEIICYFFARIHSKIINEQAAAPLLFFSFIIYKGFNCLCLLFIIYIIKTNIQTLVKTKRIKYV